MNKLFVFCLKNHIANYVMKIIILSHATFQRNLQ